MSNICLSYSERRNWAPSTVFAHVPSASGRVDEDRVVLIRAIRSRGPEKKVKGRNADH